MYKMDEVRHYHDAGYSEIETFNNMKNKYPTLSIDWLYKVFEDMDKEDELKSASTKSYVAQTACCQSKYASTDAVWPASPGCGCD